MCTGVLWGGPVGANETFDRAIAAYERGDYAEALDGFRILAVQGNAKAQFNLGLMYAKGQGVPQHYVQAHMWFNLAAAQGLKIAKKDRDIAASLMTPSQIEKAQTLAAEWRPKK
jgi:TPR repeat protein